MRELNSHYEILVERKRTKSWPTVDPSLHLAVRSGEIDTVKGLLEAGADANARDTNGVTALHSATEAGLLSAVQVLTSHAATDINARILDGSTSLVIAVRFSTHDIAEALIRAGADVKAEDELGKTALHWAALFNKAETVGLLIEFGATVDAKDKTGRTPLHDAAGARSSEAIVKQLLKAGADANAEDSGGRTPLHAAIEVHDKSFIPSALLHHPATNLNARTIRGTSPLILATRLGKAEVCEELINLGADVNATDGSGKTALHWAATGGRNNGTSIGAGTERMKIVRMLLDAGIDVNIQDGEGRTPLQLSAETPVSISVTMRLLEHPGTNVKVRMKNGTTPLMSSMNYACPTVIVGLIKAGVDIDEADNQGNTALHWAVDRCNMIAAEILLRYRANPDIQNHEGQTSLHRASIIGYSLLTDILLEKFANRDIRDNMGKLPIDIAREQGREGDAEVIMLLQEHMPAA